MQVYQCIIMKVGKIGDVEIDTAFLDRLVEEAAARERHGQHIPLVDVNTGLAEGQRKLGKVLNVRRQGDTLIADVHTAFGKPRVDLSCEFIWRGTPKILAVV